LPKTNPTEGDDDEGVQQASRHDLARASAPRYAHSSRTCEGQLLDEFCAITGKPAKHALVLLSDPPAEGRRGTSVAAHAAMDPPRWPSCGMWLVSDRRHLLQTLSALSARLLERLRHWHALRHGLRGDDRTRRADEPGHHRSRACRFSHWTAQTRYQHDSAGHAAQAPVAIKTFANWTETVLAFVEVELWLTAVWTGAGPFLYTLTLVDVATGWVSSPDCATTRSDCAHRTTHAAGSLPSGSSAWTPTAQEFLNKPLWSTARLTHHVYSRTSLRKNDSCFVEQKNWAVVRRLVGYQRLESPALAALERVTSCPATT